ncbi:hypothetical protein [Micromonospora maritima]|uniref:hypothetical protein n=1 Tax=Micromonospora maritima TaxID=986711 RepID=UPI00157BB7C4|nr:hypothetical protein [Micromonospora maritima]
MTSPRVKRARTRIAWCLLVGSIAGWPASAWWVWWYRSGFDPFEQLMLFLSWLAITIVAADFLTTSQVHEEQGGRD